MGTRKVFYDESGKLLSCYIIENGELYIEIKVLAEIPTYIVLKKADALQLIIEMNKLRKDLQEK